MNAKKIANETLLFDLIRPHICMFLLNIVYKIYIVYCIVYAYKIRYKFEFRVGDMMAKFESESQTKIEEDILQIMR